MSKEAAIEVLKSNVSRFDSEELKKAFKKWEKVVQYNFTDIDEVWSIEVNQGDARLVEGQAKENPELEYFMTTDTIVKLNTGELNGMQAYKQGLIKTKGAIRDMIKWKKVGNIKVED